ncbi:type II secretion system protein [Deinococcus maricopensis]|uniref:Putative pilus assembly protein n=1 Tax=Deinococcus maricopensis (strain DSM 21211 / LMG 22137 / NRRL B-23946 / LB-34) TaxID=709986 RepID=E8UB10_DEIML|nr:type II secretion system protein [Deinococcus maricopensis]ADV68249.1 putative pilus assembly protein [Deinococcus maricopensis DSM 21211]
MNTHRTQGFTLQELLIVMFIVGIIATLTLGSMQRLNRTTQLRAAATQFASDLNRIRSAATTQNQNTSLTLNSTGTAYTMQFAGQTQTVNLPSGFTVQGVQDSSGSWVAAASSQWKVAYSAPYGEVDATSNGFQFQATSNDLTPRIVRVVGVTGKVLNGE